MDFYHQTEGVLTIIRSPSHCRKTILYRYQPCQQFWWKIKCCRVAEYSIHPAAFWYLNLKLPPSMVNNQFYPIFIHKNSSTKTGIPGLVRSCIEIEPNSCSCSVVLTSLLSYSLYAPVLARHTIRQWIIIISTLICLSFVVGMKKWRIGLLIYCLGASFHWLVRQEVFSFLG